MMKENTRLETLWFLMTHNVAFWIKIGVVLSLTAFFSHDGTFWEFTGLIAPDWVDAFRYTGYVGFVILLIIAVVWIGGGFYNQIKDFFK